MKTKERETPKTVKIGSSVTLPSTFSTKPALDPATSAPVTQSPGKPSILARREEGAEHTNPVTRSPPRSSIKTAKTDVDVNDGFAGHPDWFTFDPDAATDESEAFSNLSDLLRDHTSPKQQPVYTPKHSNAEKLIDEAAMSSPESRGREKTVRYAQSQPSYQQPSQPRHDESAFTSVSFPTFTSEAERGTSRRNDSEPPQKGRGAVSQPPVAPHSQLDQLYPDAPPSPRHRGSLPSGPPLHSHNQGARYSLQPQSCLPQVTQNGSSSSPHVLSSPKQTTPHPHTPSGLVESTPYCQQVISPSIYSFLGAAAASPRPHSYRASGVFTATAHGKGGLCTRCGHQVVT